VLFDGAYSDVLRFAQRRLPSSHAEEAVAEAFMVAWRRIDEAPRRPGEARAWLFGITRNCLLKARRSQDRQDALAVRIRDTAPAPSGQGLEPDLAAQWLDLVAAWRALSAGEQEVLALAVFDDLSSPQAARVIGRHPRRLPPAADARPTRPAPPPRRRRRPVRHRPRHPGEHVMTVPPGNINLRFLDAADATLDSGQRHRADALLQQILTTPVFTDTRARVPGPPRRPGRRSVVWVTVTAAAVTVGLVMLPGPAGSGMAYASWAASPSPVTAGDLDAVTRACRHELHSYGHGGDLPRFNAATIPVTVAERRGDYVAVLFHRDSPDTSASCVAGNRPGSTQVDHVDTAAGGSSGPATSPPPGQISQGGISQFGGHNRASFADGAVGTQVAAVTIHADGRVVQATISNGRFAAWWPGKAFADGPAQPSGQGGPQLNLRYEVTLTDGTTYSPTLLR